MIRSVVFSNPQNTALISRCSRRAIEKLVQRRLFANGSDRVGGYGLDDLNNEDRQELLKTLLMVSSIKAIGRVFFELRVFDSIRFDEK